MVMEVINMNRYYYCVNTFDREGHVPLQHEGYIEAESEKDTIQKLIERGVIYSSGYEFLDLYAV